MGDEKPRTIGIAMPPQTDARAIVQSYIEDRVRRRDDEAHMEELECFTWMKSKC
jgi:hypothetical protein